MFISISRGSNYVGAGKQENLIKVLTTINYVQKGP